MPTREYPMHDWTTFWGQIEHGNESPRTTDCPTEDKATFERQVERMVRASVPEPLDRLAALSGDCTWEWTAPAVGDQKGGTVCLKTAIRVASYAGEQLDVRDVLAQLPGQVYRSTRARDGVVVAPRPDVDLPFPTDHLRRFLDELKDLARTTCGRFASRQNGFLDSLPPRVKDALDEELFELAVRVILDASDDAAHSPSRCDG